MLEILRNRRSIRKFTTAPVSKEDRDSILKAGLLAPSGKNQRPLEYVVIEDIDLIRKLPECKAHGTSPLTTATLVIAVLGNFELCDTWVEEASISTMLMQLQIEKLGLGSTWVQLRLRTDKNGQSSEEALRKLLNFPANIGVLSLLAIGHKAENHAPYTDADLNFTKIHYEKYGNK